MARLQVKRRSPQESLPTQHRVHLASGAAALGWPRHKNRRLTHAEISLLRRALSALIMSSPKAAKKESVIVVLQGSVTKTSEESLHDQPSAMAAGGHVGETVGVNQ